MCDPASAMVGLTLAGTAVTAFGQISQGNTANDMGLLQQRAYDQQAQNVQAASAFEQANLRRKQEAVAANARAQVGASGVALEGSPTEVLTNNAAEGQLDIDAIQYGSTLKQNQLQAQGAISAFSGKQAQKAGYIAGASTLFSGIGKAFTPSVKMGGSVFA